MVRNFLFFFNNPGEIKDHIWKERKGKEIKAAVKNATLTFVKKASCNAVYI
jgi:hypothetical protein